MSFSSSESKNEGSFPTRSKSKESASGAIRFFSDCAFLMSSSVSLFSFSQCFSSLKSRMTPFFSNVGAKEVFAPALQRKNPDCNALFIHSFKRATSPAGNLSTSSTHTATSCSKRESEEKGATIVSKELSPPLKKEGLQGK